MDTPQGKLRAARAAEMDARRKLAERIAGLNLRAQTTVREFVTQHDDIHGRVDAIIVDADVLSTRFDNGTAVVTISLPGMRVWGIVNEPSGPGEPGMPPPPPGAQRPPPPPEDGPGGPPPDEDHP
jgi:hypothetical protein